MIEPDITNAVFEFVGALFVCASIHSAYQEKNVAGINILTPIFFFSWGLWNPYYYTTLEQWYSFSAGIFLMLANMIWIGQLIFYRYFANGC